MNPYSARVISLTLPTIHSVVVSKTILSNSERLTLTISFPVISALIIRTLSETLLEVQDTDSIIAIIQHIMPAVSPCCAVSLKTKVVLAGLKRLCRCCQISNRTLQLQISVLRIIKHSLNIYNIHKKQDNSNYNLNCIRIILTLREGYARSKDTEMSAFCP